MTQQEYQQKERVQKMIAKEKRRIEKIKARFGCIYYGELITGVPIDILYHLREGEI